MLVAIVVMAVGLGIDLLGIKGFTQDGIPLTTDHHLTGATGRVLGTAFLLVGSPIALAGLWLLMMSTGG